jgi:hypothetical protein
MLTKGQIQQIDTYLESIGIEYFDFRQELTDHIAEEVEQNLQLRKSVDFNAAFEEAKAHYPTKDLIEQQFIAKLDAYNPLKEWKYFNGKRILNSIAVYTAAILPAFLISEKNLNFLLLIYVLFSAIESLRMIFSFRAKYKPPGKKLITYSREALLPLLVPFLIFVFYVGKSLINGKFFDKPMPVIVFMILVFAIVFALFALHAHLDYEKERYLNAKRHYPFLFES